MDCPTLAECNAAEALLELRLAWRVALFRLPRKMQAQLPRAWLLESEVKSDETPFVKLFDEEEDDDDTLSKFLTPPPPSLAGHTSLLPGNSTTAASTGPAQSTTTGEPSYPWVLPAAPANASAACLAARACFERVKGQRKMRTLSMEMKLVYVMATNAGGEFTTRDLCTRVLEIFPSAIAEGKSGSDAQYRHIRKHCSVMASEERDKEPRMTGRPVPVAEGTSGRKSLLYRAV